jgi:hypothetical protein
MTQAVPLPIFRKLLLASECTEFDAGAERVALAVASALAVPLRVVFPLVSNAEYEAVAPKAAAAAEREAAKGLTILDASAKRAGVALDTEVRRGPEPDREIIDEVDRSGADLLILRRRGKSGFLRRLLIGEMVERILDRVRCNVLVVPRLCNFWERSVMVIADDVDINSAIAIASVGATLARQAHLPLSVLVISSVDDPAARTALSPIAASADSPGRSSLGVRMSTKDGVRDEVRAAIAEGVDLLVVSYGATGTSAGELMRHLIRANDVPVLAVRN